MDCEKILMTNQPKYARIAMKKYNLTGQWGKSKGFYVTFASVVVLENGKDDVRAYIIHASASGVLIFVTTVHEKWNRAPTLLYTCGADENAFKAVVRRKKRMSCGECLFLLNLKLGILPTGKEKDWAQKQRQNLSCFHNFSTWNTADSNYFFGFLSRIASLGTTVQVLLENGVLKPWTKGAQIFCDAIDITPGGPWNVLNADGKSCHFTEKWYVRSKMNLTAQVWKVI